MSSQAFSPSQSRRCWLPLAFLLPLLPLRDLLRHLTCSHLCRSLLTQGTLQWLRQLKISKRLFSLPRPCTQLEEYPTPLRTLGCLGALRLLSHLRLTGLKLPPCHPCLCQHLPHPVPLEEVWAAPHHVLQHLLPLPVLLHLLRRQSSCRRSRQKASLKRRESQLRR